MYISYCKKYCIVDILQAVLIYEVEKTLKDSLDLTPSPSPSEKTQIMVRKVCLRCKNKTKGWLTSPSNVLPYYLK